PVPSPIAENTCRLRSFVVVMSYGPAARKTRYPVVGWLIAQCQVSVAPLWSVPVWMPALRPANSLGTVTAMSYVALSRGWSFVAIHQGADAGSPMMSIPGCVSNTGLNPSSDTDAGSSL